MRVGDAAGDEALNGLDVLAVEIFERIGIRVDGAEIRGGPRRSSTIRVSLHTLTWSLRRGALPTSLRGGEESAQADAQGVPLAGIDSRRPLLFVKSSDSPPFQAKRWC
jgi:hypothetical protein